MSDLVQCSVVQLILTKELHSVLSFPLQVNHCHLNVSFVQTADHIQKYTPVTLQGHYH